MRLMLHDDYSAMSSDDTLNVWPPIKWDQFRPKSRNEILDHYYAHSTGCKTPTAWGLAAASAGAVASAAFGPALLAGAKSALGAIKLKGLFSGATKSISALGTAVKKNVGDEAVDQMSKQVENTFKAEAKKEADSARNRIRKQTDGNQEKQRIVDTYNREYLQMQSKGFQNNVANLSLDQLKAQLQAAKNSVKVAEDKCKKTPCDTAGCRNMGVLKVRVQYLQALIKSYTSSGTSTPQEFNQKFSKQAVAGKTSMAGFGGGLLPAIILGALFFSSRK